MLAVATRFVLLANLLAQSSAIIPSAEDKAKAKDLLAEGLVFTRQGQHARALDKFYAAYAAYPSPKLWFNIGQVELALDHPAEAIAAFDKFLTLVLDARPEEKKIARAAVTELGRKLGRLLVKCETAGAEVAVDGRNAGRIPLPGPLWAAPGSHQVTLTREGFLAATETVEMSAGATTMVVLRLVQVPPPSPGPHPNPLPAALGEGAGLEPLPARSVEAPGPPRPAQPLWAREGAGPPRPAQRGEVPSRTEVGDRFIIPGSESAQAPATTPPALDLSAQSTSTEVPSEGRAIYKTWWFWTGAVVAVAGAITTAVVVARQGGSNVPNTPLGNHGVFQ